MRQFLSLVTSSLLLSGLIGWSTSIQFAWAAAPNGAVSPNGGSQVSERDLGLLETRLFSRQYANDPIEKRVERLELMIFAATQEGSLTQRFERLKSAMAAHAAAGKSSAGNPSSSAKIEGSGKSDAVDTPAAKSPGKESYPVLNTLEWRALKKTYPQESLDGRLGRLEKKLFGADSQTMSYFDRVERLKRTLGVGVTAQTPAPVQQAPLGPMPKARPRGQMPDNYFGFNPPVFGDEGTDAAPGMPDVTQQPFGAPFGFGMNPAFNQIFKDMNRQLRQLEQMRSLGNGTWVFDQDTGTWVEQNTGRRVKPGNPDTPTTPLAPNTLPKKRATPAPGGPFGAAPELKASPLLQQLQPKQNDLPPYADPNSI
jgi:hypothetical protein